MILGTRRSDWLPILTFLAGPASRFAQVLEIPDAVQAGAGAIRIEHLASVGAARDGPWLSRLTSIDMDSEGYFFAAPTYERGQIAVFDAAGTQRGSFGDRAGTGREPLAGDSTPLRDRTVVRTPGNVAGNTS